MTNNYNNNNNNNNNNMAWQGAAAQGLSMLGGFIGANSQHQRQKGLMGIQHKNQMALNRQGQRMQMDMWKNTSYPAQLKMMKEAGLSPGLMYGGGPGQGGTTGSQTGGSAASGNAAAFTPMDVSALKMGAELKLINAQKDAVNESIEKSKWERGEKGKQEIAESLARETNINEDTKLKAQQKLNMISDRELTEAKTKMENMKFDKKVTGSFLVDTFTQMGLDPLNNPWHRILINTMVFSWFGAGMLEKIAMSTSRGMFAKIFGDNAAGKYYKGDVAIDGRGNGLTQAPKDLGLPGYN